MEKTIVSTGKTIDLAIEAALNQLGLDRDSVSVMVLQQAKSGFLGFGAQPAKVQLTYEVPDPVVEKAPEKPKSALGSASRSKPKATAIPGVTPEPAKPEAPKPAAVKQEAPKAPRQDKPKAPRPEKKAEAPKAPREPKPEKKAEPKVYAPAETGSTEEKIEQFIKGLLEHMGSKAVPHCEKVDANTYKVDLVGDDLGYLIGRRGDTLDAIQHLTNYTINRGVDGHVRVNVDAECYREKREESLRRYARKKAQQVLKARRRTTLEPMNAYERHVIHAALQDMDNITTHSTGVEPNRRVVIEYVR
ncbi:MAG: RNA-binding cell elongation regulator Jag/EloR [Eubacteriales bacterium]|nr:RNA-binding cell elongation regulator Jag/EloR [Eubacteriales bacterium]